MSFCRRLLLVYLCGLSACIACGDLLIGNAWVRLPPPGMTMTAAYFTITNQNPTPRHVVSITSPDFSGAELHETRHQDGRAVMREVGELTLSANETVVAAPGGLHLMLWGPQSPLTENAIVSVELTCAEGGSSRVDLPVLKRIKAMPTAP